MDSKKCEQIVAYLDGELNEDEATVVDRLLSDDGTARRQVEQYSRAWDMLDLLPVSHASNDFAERTLTAIRSGHADKIEEQVSDAANETQPSPTARLARRIAIQVLALVGLFLVALIGFHANFGQGAEPIDQVLRDLPMLRRLDEYQQVETTKFLQKLDRSGVFHDNR